LRALFFPLHRPFVPFPPPERPRHCSYRSSSLDLSTSSFPFRDRSGRCILFHFFLFILCPRLSVEPSFLPLFPPVTPPSRFFPIVTSFFSPACPPILFSTLRLFAVFPRASFSCGPPAFLSTQLPSPHLFSCVPIKHPGFFFFRPNLSILGSPPCWSLPFFLPLTF